MLIDALEKLAASRGAVRLTADVSDSAQDFFKRRGFVAKQRNSVPLGNEWLANTTMEKRLAAKERARNEQAAHAASALPAAPSRDRGHRDRGRRRAGAQLLSLVMRSGG